MLVQEGLHPDGAFAAGDPGWQGGRGLPDWAVPASAAVAREQVFARFGTITAIELTEDKAEPQSSQAMDPQNRSRNREALG